MYLADKLGFSIKLLGIATQIETRDGTPAVIQRVHPALVDKNTALGGTHGVLNGLFTLGDFVGPVFSQVIRTIHSELIQPTAHSIDRPARSSPICIPASPLMRPHATVAQGKGAGREATASACVSDLIDIARGHYGAPTFGVPSSDLGRMVTAGMDERVGQYFLRVSGGPWKLQNLLTTLELAGIERDAAASSASGNSAVRRGHRDAHRCALLLLLLSHICVMPLSATAVASR